MHRALASGLSMPVGFKNGTDGNISTAIEAAVSAGAGHSLLGVDDSGEIRAFRTCGNKDCHLILRGGTRPNYDRKSVLRVQSAMKAAGLRPNLVVDCSHGNSGKFAKNQVKVFNNVLGQKAQGNQNIVGIMIESYLNPGKQKLPEKLAGFKSSKLKYGVSVTDECLGWDMTEKIVLEAYE
jgi:3-deoxy-7-phosphoheptulonate synthase